MDGFEYRLVSLANKMLSEFTIKKKVGFLSGHGETDPTRDFDTFARLLSQQYDITKIDPDENQEIDLNLQLLRMKYGKIEPKTSSINSRQSPYITSIGSPYGSDKMASTIHPVSEIKSICSCVNT